MAVHGNQMTNELLLQVLSIWGYEGSLVDVAFSGSPERSLARHGVTTPRGFMVLEEIAAEDVHHKEAVAGAIAQVSRCGLSVVVPFVSRAGNYIEEMDGRWWQLRSWLPSEPLPRPGYLNEPWRANEAASFLASLRACGVQTSALPSFNLQFFLEDLWRKLESDGRDIHNSLGPFYAVIEKDLFPVLGELPLTFSHADFHPRNILWGNERIVAVIDWEFCGLRHDLFDVAHMISVAASEERGVLRSPFVTRFLHEAVARKLLSQRSAEVLPLYVVALRFLWLSLWLRQNDEDMIDFEVYFIQYLFEQRNFADIAEYGTGSYEGIC